MKVNDPATADKDGSQIQVGGIKGVMIDEDGSSASNAPTKDDAPRAPGGEVPAHSTRSGNGKIATPPPEKQRSNTENIKSNADIAGADCDSEAETLIESPEKRKLNILESASRLQPTTFFSNTRCTIRQRIPIIFSSKSITHKTIRTSETRCIGRGVERRRWKATC